MSVAPSLRALLLSEHDALDGKMTAVRDASRANVDSRTLTELWSRFAHALEAHLHTEEDAIFPVLESRHADEIVGLRLEHTWFREQLEQLTMQVELHTIRDDQIGRFLDRLRAHASREDGALYQWAEAELPASVQSEITAEHHRS